MHEQKTCKLCVIAWFALVLLVAGLFAMPFAPNIGEEEPTTAPPLPSYITIETKVVDPATIGSMDRPEMLYPDD